MRFLHGVVIELPILTCDGCGACCTFVRTPPHLVFWQDGQPIPIDGEPTADFDYQALMAAPEEARRLFREKRLSNAPAVDPCAWLDLETRKCRFHEFRAEICHSFEVSSGACHYLRSKTGYVRLS